MQRPATKRFTCEDPASFDKAMMQYSVTHAYHRCFNLSFRAQRLMCEEPASFRITSKQVPRFTRDDCTVMPSATLPRCHSEHNASRLSFRAQRLTCEEPASFRITSKQVPRFTRDDKTP